MFESLSERLGKIFEGLTGRGALSEADVDAALREVRRALLMGRYMAEPGANCQSALTRRAFAPIHPPTSLRQNLNSRPGPAKV